MKERRWYPLWGFLYGVALLVAASQALTPGRGSSFVGVLASSPLFHLAGLVADKLVRLLTIFLGGLSYWTLVGYGLKHANRPIARAACALALLANYIGILFLLEYEARLLSRIFLSPSGLVYLLGQVAAWRVIVMAQTKR